MSWTKVDVEGRVMWERSDGIRVDSTQSIDAIEKAESEALRKSFEEMIYTRESWDLEKQNKTDEDENPLVQLIIFAIVTLVYFISTFVSQ